MAKFTVTRTKTVTEEFTVEAADCESASRMESGAGLMVDVRCEVWARDYKQPINASGMGSTFSEEDAESE
jgi:hypothetical protein